MNLIGNAVKFTESGGIDVKIKKKGRSIECSVIDTGIGISDEDKRQLFKKFYQAPKKELVKQEQSGTGLGLSITKDIIALHGGKMGLRVAVRQGQQVLVHAADKPQDEEEASIPQS